MNEDQKYISIGKFVATHGLRGELVLRHGLGKKTALKGLSTIFIKDKTGSFLPWFIEPSRVKNDTEIFIKPEELHTKEAAQPLVQKEVWITQADFKKFAAKTAVINLLGFTIRDGEKLLGTVEEVIEQPHQVLCRIEMSGREVLIPLHEDTLRHIDRRNKIILVELPDGLLDIYLS